MQHVTTLSQLRHWEDRARKGDRALIALSQAHAGIRDYLASDPEVRAMERDGFLVVKKLRCPLRPQHAQTSTISSPISRGSAKLSGGNGLLVKYQPPHIKTQR
jgi:hypothetical protein